MRTYQQGYRDGMEEASKLDWISWLCYLFLGFVTGWLMEMWLG